MSETRTNNASTQTQNSGETKNNNMVGWRDAYNTLGELDLLNTSAESSATTGGFSIGSVYSGRTNSGVGLVKMVMIGAIGFVGYYLWKRYIK